MPNIHDVLPFVMGILTIAGFVIIIVSVFFQKGSDFAIHDRAEVESSPSRRFYEIRKRFIRRLSIGGNSMFLRKRRYAPYYKSHRKSRRQEGSEDFIGLMKIIERAKREGVSNDHIRQIYIDLAKKIAEEFLVDGESKKEPQQSKG